MKILYAASCNSNAKIALARFVRAMQGSVHQIKIAAYKISSPKEISIDWTLDCLQNIFKPDFISLDNDNFSTYYQQVKYYNPDLIISDMEYFTSYISNLLNIKLWQCSSSLIQFAMTTEYRYALGIYKKYAILFNKNPTNYQRLVNIIDNSDSKFVYSHLADTIEPPELKPEFQWIRPYHYVGKDRITCQHNIVAAVPNSNKRIIHLLKNHYDSVYFSDNIEENYPNPIIKSLDNEEEYYCNLKNCNLFVCQGQTSFLADAFYNNKFSVVLPNIEDKECVINSAISEKVKCSISIYSNAVNLDKFKDSKVSINLNKIDYLHEKIEKL